MMVLPARRARFQESLDQLMRHRRANHLGTQRQHIHIIVFHTLMRRVNIVTERGPHTKELKVVNLARQTRDVCNKDSAHQVGVDHFLQPLPARTSLGR